MKEWLRKLIAPNYPDEDRNRQAFNLNVILLTTLVVMLLGIIAMLLQVGQRPMSYILPNTAFILVAAAVLGLCFYFSKNGRVQWAALIFIGMISIACASAVLVGGTRGALPVILVIPIVTAGVALNSRASLGIAVVSTLALVLMSVLEINDVIRIQYPRDELAILLNLFDNGFAFFFLVMGIWLAGFSLQSALQRTQAAANEANQFRRDLEKSLQAEQKMRDRLQSVIAEYTAFLSQIGQGDYKARLPLPAEDENLASLGRLINATVDSLVDALAQTQAALDEVDAAHRRYLVRSWKDYVRSRRSAQVEVGRPQATQQREALAAGLSQAATQGKALRLDFTGEESSPAAPAVVAPLVLRGEVVGSLGLARQPGQRPWTADEQALVEAVAQRLVLAAENMRLLEETQKRAARERLVGEVTARIRESLDVETVLQTAVQEIFSAMTLNDVSIRLQENGNGSAQTGQGD